MIDLTARLDERAEELMVYKMPRNAGLMDEIFAFDPRNLEATESAKISQYAIGLSQFLVFFTSQINKSKVLLMQKEHIVDSYVAQSDIKAKTVQEKRIKVIEASAELKIISDAIELLECEIQMTENLEKYYIELINSLKRELTRREVEQKFSRDERRI
jgi:hypothetical protein